MNINDNRQKLIQAITENQCQTISSFLDDNCIHSDLPKDLFMEKLEEMFEFIEDMEGEDAITSVQEDVDLREYAKEHGYCDPVFFRVNDSYFIMDIYETANKHFCIDMCDGRFSGTELSNCYQMDIYDDERASFVPDEAYLALKSTVYEILKVEKTNLIHLWTPKYLKEWLAKHQSLFEQLKSYSNIREMFPYTTFYDQASEISHVYQNYEYYKGAIAAYKDVHYANSEQNYYWVKDFDGLLFVYMRSCDLLPHDEYKEFFSVEPSIPNHYFLLKGYEQLIPYLNLNRVAYCTSMEYRGQQFSKSLENFEEE
jgi:hypothetical protein